MADTDNNYVIGSGKVYFDKFLPGTKTPTGERYFGNTPELSESQSAETLDHYDADGPAKQKDDSVDLSRDASLSIVCDNISADNLALWWLGVKDTVAVAGATATQEEHIATLGNYYQLGASTALPQGHGGVTNVSINSSGGTRASKTGTFSGVGTADDTITVNGVVFTLKASAASAYQVTIGGTAAATAANFAAKVNAKSAETGVTAVAVAEDVTLTATVGGTEGNAIVIAESGTGFSFAGGATLLSGGGAGDIAAEGNWEVDETTGRVHILEDAEDIDDDDVLTIEYDNSSQSVSQVIAQGDTIYGALRFIADNRKGANKDRFYPYVKLSPDGDYALKGDDWQSMSFTAEVLKLNSTTERVYITNR